MEALVKKYIGEFLAAMIAGFVTWFYKRKISRVEVDNAILRNSEKIMSMYKGITNDMKSYYDSQVGAMKGRISELECKQKACEERNAKLERRLSAYLKGGDPNGNKSTSAGRDFREKEANN